MTTAYTNNLKLGKPATSDRLWGVVRNANCDTFDALAPIGGLNVSTVEVPSASLNVRVAAGKYPNADGSRGTYAGTASTGISASSTAVLYLDLTSSGALVVAASYPTATAHVPLATVVAGASTITSITDDRVPGGLVLRTLVNAASDAAAAGLGVAIGALYRTGSAVMIRVT